METTNRPNGIAPVHGPGYTLGAKGGRMAQAWQYVWDRLNKNTWTEGSALAAEAAKAHGLQAVTVTEMLSRMRAAGVIERGFVALPTTYVRYGKEYTSNRERVHYRIPEKTR